MWLGIDRWGEFGSLWLACNQEQAVQVDPKSRSQKVRVLPPYQQKTCSGAFGSQVSNPPAPGPPCCEEAQLARVRRPPGESLRSLKESQDRDIWLVSSCSTNDRLQERLQNYPAELCPIPLSHRNQETSTNNHYTPLGLQINVIQQEVVGIGGKT